MKKYLMGIAVSFAIIMGITANPVMADEESNAVVNFYYSTDNHATYNDAPTLLNVGQIDGAHIGPSQPMVNPLPGSKTLPNWLKDRKWRIMRGDDWNIRGVSVKALKKGYSWRCGEDSMYLDEPIETTKDRLIILDYYPEVTSEIYPVSVGLAFQKTENKIGFKAKYTATKKAWNENKAKYYTILYEVVPKNKGRVAAIGTAAVLGHAFGAGDTSPANKAVSGVTGSGFGVAEAWVWNGGPFMAIGWSKEPPKRQARAPKKPPADKQKTANVGRSTPPPLVKTTRKLYFELNSYEIVTAEQRAAIKEHTAAINKALDTLGPDEYIIIMGGACELGTLNHNIILGRNRGEAEAKIVAPALVRVYKRDPKFVQDKVRFASIGEHFPDKLELMMKDRKKWRKLNRSNFIIKSTPI
ncbi:hypothetical protein K8R32_05445 [bacterium]|nr:hypothetical protein [bacterium]